MGLVLLLVYFVTLSFVLKKWKWIRHSGIKSQTLIGLFGLKTLVGFGLVFLYSHYYDSETADIFIYYHDAIYLKQLILSNRIGVFFDILFNHNISSPSVYNAYIHLRYWDSSTVDFLVYEKRLVILLNLFFSFFSVSHIYIHSMFMAFIGFLGQIGIYRFVKRQSNLSPLIILFFTFLLPTFTLWSASILKEPLIIFSVGLFLFFIGKWVKRWNRKYLFGAILFYALGLVVKPYVMLSLSLPIFIFILFKIRKQWPLSKQSLIVAGSLLGLLLLFWGLSFININIFEKLAGKQGDFYKTIELAEQDRTVGSFIDVGVLDGSMWSVIYHTPKAFLNVLLRPNVLDYKTLLYLPDIFQNLLFLMLIMGLFLKFRKPKPEEYPFLWLSVLFVIVLFTLIGLVTPVLGAIVRYKIPALIFLFFFILSFLKMDFISKKYSSLFLWEKKKNKILR